jgi:hypothetical protein
MNHDMIQSNSSVAPMAAGADGMQYEQAIAFLTEQERRANLLAEKVEAMNALRLEIWMEASFMEADHRNATDALARFGITAPSMNDSTDMLNRIANPVTSYEMVEAFMVIDVVASGCADDRANLQARFGTAWEILKAEQVDGQFLNG